MFCGELHRTSAIADGISIGFCEVFKDLEFQHIRCKAFVSGRIWEGCIFLLADKLLVKQIYPYRGQGPRERFGTER